MNVPALRFKEFRGDWEAKKLRDISAQISYGLTVRPEYINDGIPLISAREIKDGVIDYEKAPKISQESYDKLSDKAMARKGDIFLSKTGTIGLIAYVSSNIPLAITQNIAVIRIEDESYFHSFILHSLRTRNFYKSAIDKVNQSTIMDLQLQDIRKLKISIPSLPEQTKIANFLTAVDDKITLLTKKADLLSQYKKGVMQQIFSQELRFKDDDGQEFPEWEEKSLGDIATFRRGSFPQPYGLAKWYDDINGMPFIQVFDVDDNFRLKENTKRRISKEAQQQSVYVKSGSILVTIQGSIGRIAVTQYDAYVDRTLLLFESFKVDINKNYFAYILFLLFEIEKEKAPGGIIKTITKEVLTGFNVFICDYEEQTKIANFLTAIDEKISNNQTQLDAVKQYKQGLLQQMFV